MSREQPTATTIPGAGVTVAALLLVSLENELILGSPGTGGKPSALRVKGFTEAPRRGSLTAAVGPPDPVRHRARSLPMFSVGATRAVVFGPVGRRSPSTLEDLAWRASVLVQQLCPALLVMHTPVLWASVDAAWSVFVEAREHCGAVLVQDCRYDMALGDDVSALWAHLESLGRGRPPAS